MKSINLLLLLLLIADYADGQDCVSSANASVAVMVQLMSEEPLSMRNGSKSLLSYPDLRDIVESLNATNGTASWYVCSDDDVNGRTLEMRGICASEPESLPGGGGYFFRCSSVAEYNGQLCESSSLCQTSPFVAFQVDCKGVSKNFPDCAVNYCTPEGRDSCFSDTATADSGKSKTSVIIATVAVMVMTMSGI